ncbi:MULTISPECIES: ComEC/Rec2 family competence protein [Arthrobacter]|uniref:ComEC/Rec2 family competence protein n=1 Tax=Arthrobacter TaxID=1663 RepID=UPI001D1339DD|nr:ComEC/Rec2 family competence protein [Arthrobacter caoxuetaonis]MCC9193571.1 ComEC/Rec2 family competence protein [Arthrobacter sp. zg-Y916]
MAAVFRDRDKDRDPKADVPPRLIELRLVPVAGTAWVAAAVAIRLPASFLLPAVVAAMTLLVVVLAAAAVLHARHAASATGDEPRRRRGARAVLSMLLPPVAVAVLVSMSAGTSLIDRTAGPVGEAIDREAVISGEFRALSDARAGTPDRFSGKARYLVEGMLLSFTREGTRSGAAAPVLVIGGDTYAGIRLGDTFTTSGQLQAARPGDRAAALLRAGQGPDVVPASGLYGVASGLRTNFAAHAAGLGETDAAGLLPGMVLGDRASLPEDLAAAMKDTGLTHLTAVSGANCSYLLAFVFLLARMLKLSRFWAAAAGLGALAAFVLIVRPDASVLRAAVMGTIGTAAVLSGRGKMPASLLCLCAAILLVVDPWLSGSYAFILSVCATAGLVVLGPVFSAALERFLPHPVAVLAAIPLAAQVACAPVLVLLQPQVPMYSLPANMAAAPAVPLVTVLGMAAVVVAHVLPGLALPLVWTAGAGAGWVAAVARFFAEAPGALLPWMSGPGGAAAMAAASAGLAAGMFRLVQTAGSTPYGRRTAGGASGKTGAGGRTETGAPGFRKRAWAGAALLLAVVFLVMRCQPNSSAPVPHDWVAAACDVGQGDALALRSGPRSAVLVDAGPDPAALDACLDLLDVDTVDLLVISHVHADHYGGAAGAGQDRLLGALAFSSAERQTPPEIGRIAAAHGLQALRLEQGMLGESGSVRWEVLWPPPAGRAGQAPLPSENDASAVLLVRTAGINLLFTGDIEEEAAARMLRSNDILGRTQVHVLKVAHHGARNGGTAVPAAVRAPLALISVGEDNTYGHPAPETLAGLEASGSAVVRTDDLGTFILRLADARLVVEELR